MMTSERPKLLCLHGGGASARIFEIQLVRLRRVLDDAFDFEYLDGPLETEPGPGVLPFFEGCGPYRRWVSDDPACPADEFQAQKDRAVEFLKAQVREKGPYAGLVGFSQGARAASSLLLEQQREALVDDDNGGGGGGDNNNNNNNNKLLFALFICGTFPPFVPPEEKITAPTVHVIGLEDYYKPSSERLYEQCADDGSRRRVVRFLGGHHLPTSPDTIQQISRMVRDAYREAKRGTAIGTA